MGLEFAGSPVAPTLCTGVNNAELMQADRQAALREARLEQPGRDGRKHPELDLASMFQANVVSRMQ